MELAIPLIALGGMYIISNQSAENSEYNDDHDNEPENFDNMGANTNYLPNTNNSLVEPSREIRLAKTTRRRGVGLHVFRRHPGRCPRRTRRQRKKAVFQGRQALICS